MLIIMLTVSVVLLLACLTFFAFYMLDFRRQLVAEVSVTAKVIGNSCAAALDFNDTQTATESLAALRAQPDIIGACVYDRDGNVFATFQRNAMNGIAHFPPPQPPGHEFRNGQLHTFQPITVRGETVGTIYLAQSLSELWVRLERSAWVMIGIFGIALGIALLLSARFHRIVTNPILQLAQLTRTVALEKNYSVRATRQTDDELGQLVDGFNEMLSQIQARDAALQAARDGLEQRVKERTAELAESLSQLNATLDSTADGILVINRDGKKILQNQQTIDLWKIPPHIVVGDDDDAQVRHVMEATKNPEQFREKILNFYAHPDERGQDEIELKDGTIMERTTAPVLGKDGRNYGRIWTFRDITKRKQAEAELAHEQDLLRTLLDRAPDHIYFKDVQSRFIKASAAQARQFGLGSADEVVGKSDFDFFSDERARLTFEDEQKIIRTGEPLIGKVEQELWKDGRAETWVLTSKMPLRNRAGEIIGTFGISKDISPIKMAEARLQEVHKQLLETSRQAGMAEVATNVLHNVGNVLNSVNVSAALVADNMKKSKVPNLAKVVTLLNGHAADLGAFMTSDPKGRHVPGYLNQLAEQLTREQRTAIEELELLRKNIEHIKDIVAMQQSYAKISGITETVEVSDLVEDALRMNAGALSRHEVKVIREYSDMPPVILEKHKVLQILVNLIRNAKYACDGSGRTDKQLRIQIAPSGKGFRISVIDNGIGIPPENLTRIFNHGFTTRKDGHGFGLHGGALAAKELGGLLTVHSEGTNRGAIFTVELPFEPPSN